MSNSGLMPTLPIRLSNFERTHHYVKSPFRYPGGKYYAVKSILPFIDGVPHIEYREPFVGGGTVFFAKQKAKHNWINDLEPNLMATYRVMADNLGHRELAKRIAVETASRERHLEVQQLTVETNIDIAFKFFYLNRTSYSGIVNKPAWGYKEGKSSPPQNWVKFIYEAYSKLKNVRLTNLDFSEVIDAPAEGATVLIYCDPPYYHADQKRAYTKPFLVQDHERLAKHLRDTKHFFCLSYDDCEEIRELYTWAHIYEASWLYNTANIKGERRITGRELIITNYPVGKPSQMVLGLK